MHILLRCDESPAFHRTLRCAASCAVRQNALLRGAYCPDGEPWEGGREAARRTFLAAAANVGINAEWLDDPAPGIEQFLQHAFASDLVITGQPHLDNDPRQRQLIERLVHWSGRPVVVVPYAGEHRLLGERVMVTWSEGRESARALLDAMPFLRLANRVTLFRILAEHASRSPEHDAEIRSFLSHHGVKAIVETAPTDGLAIGDVILNHACEDGSDLIVMGACDLRREHGDCLGAVASHLLQVMTVPVLMSH